MEAKDAPPKITNEMIEQAGRIDAWIATQMAATARQPTKHKRPRREGYRTWLRPRVLQLDADGLDVPDIARIVAREDHGNTLPEWKAVVAAVRKILEERDRKKTRLRALSAR